MIKLAQDLQVALALECVVCERLRVREDDTPTTEMLFGALPYSVCPGCGREVQPGLMADQAYRARARVRYFTLTGRVLPLEAADDTGPPPTAWRRPGHR